jgi:alkylhydroperoxidase family enzyme
METEMRTFLAAACALVALLCAPLHGEEATPGLRAIPLTRPEMKQFLEDMKARQPRIPLPPAAAEEQVAAADVSRSYESRLRALYLPFGDSRGGAARPRTEATSPDAQGAEAAAARSNLPRGLGRESDPAMSLDYRFKTSLFWIASRTNNCQYCLGHQESKLLRAGMTEDAIAALDGDWQAFTPAERAAFAFARRLTLEPHLIGDRDIEALRPHFSDLQILEMILSVAGNNSINRWKEGIGVPQSLDGGSFGRRAEGDEAGGHQSYLTPTSAEFQSQVTLVAPVLLDENGVPTRRTVFLRGPLPSRSEAERALEQCRQRTPRLPLVSDEAAREILGELAPASGPVPQWMRLLANFPVSGTRQVAGIRAADEKGDLSPLLKAQVAWIVARQDQAWYAAGQARQRLKALGQTDEQVFGLDGPWNAFSPQERAMFTVARQLAASPVVLTDEEVAEAVKLAGPRDVVQLINYTTSRAAFNRITEAAGLQLEQE